MSDMKITKKEIGNRLRICRKAKTMTQEELSEKIGIETRSYSNIEVGLRLFSVEVLLKLIQELDISADYILLGYKNDNTPIGDNLKSLDSKNITRIESIIQIFNEAISDK